MVSVVSNSFLIKYVGYLYTKYSTLSNFILQKKHIVLIQLLNFLLSTPIINDLIGIFKTFKCNDWLISQPKAGWLGKYRQKRVNNRQLKI